MINYLFKFNIFYLKMSYLNEAFPILNNQINYNVRLNYQFNNIKPKKSNVDIINEKIHKEDQQKEVNLINSLSKIINNEFKRVNNLTDLYNKNPNYQLIRNVNLELIKKTNHKFNSEKLPVEKILNLSNDEINKLSIILEDIIPIYCKPPDYSPYLSTYIGYKLYKFFNVKKYTGEKNSS